MHKKIQDMAYARFQYEKPAPRFSVERLEFEVLQEEVYRGSFSLTSVNGVPIKGIVYSSNPRMECCTPKFMGNEITIEFEFHSEGLIEGDIQKGDFTIVCNGGEYNLSFVVLVTKRYANSSIGEIKNLFDFANLAQVSYEEAYGIFKSPLFINVLKDTEEKERLLYWTVGAEKATMEGMEEFLIGIRKKQKVSFSLENKEKTLSNLTEDMRESIRIKKEQWGYLEIYVTSDNDGVVPVKNKITTDDFVGNYADVEFVVTANKLHGGRNFARIKLASLNQTEIFELSVCQNNPGEQDCQRKKIDGVEEKKLLQRLTRLYLDFRMGRMVTGVWSKESGICLDKLRELNPKNLWYLLYQAQTLLINKQRQEAEWIFDDFCRRSVKKDTPVWAYYLYLCTLQEQDPSYVSKIFQKIQDIYHQNQDDMRLFLIMLFLNPQLNQSKSRKLSAIAQKVEEGMHSPILYMEAYHLIKNDVYLLQKPGSFEMQVLYWATREGEITEPVANRLHECVVQLRKFHVMWYKILLACYQVSSTKEMLQTICSFCIKWNLISSKEFKWFDKGIQEELRIAGLYEAWLDSAKPEQIKRFPKTAMIYFQYQNHLNYKKQAMLYAAIVINKENQKSLYNSYQKNIEHFAIEQMLAKRVDENLAILYEEILPNIAMNPEFVEALGDILYTNKLICKDEKAVRIVVVHSELKQEQVVALQNHHAYVKLYSGNYSIMAEDEKGTRYIPSDSWELKRLMQPGHYSRKLVHSDTNCIPHLIHYFDGRKTFHNLQKEDMDKLLYLMKSKEIRREYKVERNAQIVEYYYNSYTGVELDVYLQNVKYEGLPREARNKLMELMISRGIYSKAYEMLRLYGSENAAISKLMLIAGQKIIELNFEEDSFLTGLCNTIWQRGKYNEYILQYLCRYRKGTLRDMERLWKAAKEFELDTYSLEERFLTNLLYTESYTKDGSRIFKSYFESRGNEMLIMAYLSYYSYQYFVKNAVTDEELFECLEEQINLGNSLNDSCKLAYFLWLSEQKAHTTEQEEQLEKLLKEYLHRKKYFAFYQKLPQSLLQKYHMHDRIYLEYRSNPANQVLLSYCMDGDEYLEETMEQMYEGIFVKDFVVFFGEAIPYYIKEESEKGLQITESGHVTIHDVMQQNDESRYDLINGMMVSYHLKDEKTLRELYRQYNRLKEKEDAFPILL